MDKKKLPAVAAGIALAALVWLNWVHFDQINRLYGEVNELQDGLNDLKEDYRRAMDRQRLLRQEGLEREASVFSRAETSLSYDNGMLVLEAADNSENTAKRLRDRCAFYGVPLVRLPDSGEGRAGALGKNGRIAAAAVTDRQLCKLVRDTLRPAPDTLEEEHNL